MPDEEYMKGWTGSGTYDGAKDKDQFLQGQQARQAIDAPAKQRAREEAAAKSKSSDFDPWQSTGRIETVEIGDSFFAALRWLLAVPFRAVWWLFGMMFRTIFRAARGIYRTIASR